MPTELKSLKGALDSYRDYWFYMEMRFALVRLEYHMDAELRFPAAEYFASWLLGCGNRPDDSGLEQFLLKASDSAHSVLSKFSKDHFNLVTYSNFIPEFFWPWCKHSRRVFKVSGDLQALLMATDIDNLVLSDIRWPFPAFVTSLESPILVCPPNKDTPTRFQDLLVFRSGGHDGVQSFLTDAVSPLQMSIVALGEGWSDYVPLSQSERWKLQKLSTSRRRKDEFEDELTRVYHRLPYHLIYGAVPLDTDQTFAEMVRTERITNASFIREFLRVVVGLPMYLDSLPKNHSSVSDWQGVINPGNPDPSAIFDENLICAVGTETRLPAIEREALISQHVKGFEMPFHTRRGHWRRIRDAEGQIRDVVWVRHTVVREDRRPLEGGLPSGTLQQG